MPTQEEVKEMQEKLKNMSPEEYGKYLADKSIEKCIEIFK